MTYEYLLWISLFAYAVHVFEEKMLGWKQWAETALGIKNLEWADFYLANATVMIGGICTAMGGNCLRLKSILKP